MLVLSRNVGQSIVIGEGITITVTAIRGDRVRLAFDAPREVHIVRSEIQPLPKIVDVGEPISMAPSRELAEAELRCA